MKLLKAELRVVIKLYQNIPSEIITKWIILIGKLPHSLLSHNDSTSFESIIEEVNK